MNFVASLVLFCRNVVSSWSSGTGMAGIAGALVYALLTSRFVHLSPSMTLHVMIVVPLLLGVR